MSINKNSSNLVVVQSTRVDLVFVVCKNHKEVNSNVKEWTCQLASRSEDKQAKRKHFLLSCALYRFPPEGVV